MKTLVELEALLAKVQAERDALIRKAGVPANEAGEFVAACLRADAVEADLAAAKAEVERLREAPRALIALLNEMHDNDGNDWADQTLATVVDDLETALAQNPEETGQTFEADCVNCRRSRLLHARRGNLYFCVMWPLRADTEYALAPKGWSEADIDRHAEKLLAASRTSEPSAASNRSAPPFRTWRVGRKVGRTLYLDDRLVGLLDTPELATAIADAMNERTSTPAPDPREERLIGLDKRCADALADEVDVLVRRKVIDSRSPAADAPLNYRNPTPQRSNALLSRDGRIADLEAQVKRLTDSGCSMIDTIAARSERIAELERALGSASAVLLEWDRASCLKSKGAWGPLLQSRDVRDRLSILLSPSPEKPAPKEEPAPSKPITKGEPEDEKMLVDLRKRRGELRAEIDQRWPDLGDRPSSPPARYLGRLDDLDRQIQELTPAPASPSEKSAGGTFECPICGRDYPHTDAMHRDRAERLLERQRECVGCGHWQASHQAGHGPCDGESCTCRKFERTYKDDATSPPSPR